MSGIKINRDLPSNSLLESISSSSRTEQQDQIAVLPEVRKQDKFDPRTSGATKEAAASKQAEQNLVAQAQQARLFALLPSGLPKLPLIDTASAGKGFGPAPPGTMPMDEITTPDEVNYSKLGSMDIRELRTLEKQLSEQISETRTKIAELRKFITILQIQGSYPFATNEEEVNKWKAVLAAEQNKLRVLERQHQLVQNEIESRNTDERA